jgi:hypothetical protein
MAVTKVDFKPGLNREGTAYSAEGTFYDGDKIRFRSGKAEKIGGWVRLSNAQYLGNARALINWGTLGGKNLLGIGTNLKYYIEEGGAYSDITPIRSTVDPMLGPAPPSTGDPFSTAFNTLSADITAAQQTVPLTSAASFPSTGGFIKIGTEEMFYSSISGNTLLGVNRGINGTTPAGHLSGVDVSCSTITVTDVNHGAVTNDFVIFSGATGPFGGFDAADINAEQEVLGVISTSEYTFNVAGVFSTSAASGGGAAAIANYQVNTGLDIFVAGLGWGADPWSSGGWGSSGVVGVGQQLRLWSADNYGEDLFFAPRNGGVYYWDATLGTSVRGVLLNDAATTAGAAGQFVPNQTAQVISAPVQRFVICMGANPYDSTDPNTEFNPMLVRWSDQDNPFNWVLSITNQSGEFPLTDGSFIVTSANTRQEILIWTDSALYSMQYIGAPLVYRFEIMMDNLSIMSPNAVATANNVTYWMGRDKFYIYNGRVDTLPCALRQYVFEDINKDQAYQIFSGSDEGYNEVWWFYCSGTSTVIDRYVIYNYLENIWYYGSLNRTAWLDSPLREKPMAADYNNRILFHEVGNDDVSGLSPVPITAFIQSADFDIGDGNQFGFVKRILPDINFNGSSVNEPAVTMQVKPRRNAGALYGPADHPIVASANNFATTPIYTVQEFDGQVYTRLRGRQMAFRIESTDLGVAWQLGSIRIDVKPDGQR